MVTGRMKLRKLIPWCKTAAWLVAAFLSSKALIWAYAWVSPGGGVAILYRGTAFQQPRGALALKRLSYVCEGRPFPVVPRDGFSMRIKARLVVPASDTYTFASLCDDGLRMSIDGAVVIDNWRENDFHRSKHEAQRRLEKGVHDLEVEFFDRAGLARFRVEWCGGGIPPRTIVGPPYLLKAY